MFGEGPLQAEVQHQRLSKILIDHFKMWTLLGLWTDKNPTDLQHEALALASILVLPPQILDVSKRSLHPLLL